MSITSSQGDDVERGTWGTESAAIGVAGEGTPNDLGIGAVLDRDRERDRGVGRIRVGTRIAFVVVEKQLADPAIAEPAFS